MRLQKITGWSRLGNELVLTAGGAVVGLSFHQSDILRLRLNEGSALTEDPDKFIVEHPCAEPCFSVTEEASGLRLSTETSVVRITFSPFSVKAYRQDGKLLVQTKRSAPADAEKDRSVLRLSLTESEQIYGLGQDPMGNVNQRGHERRMWNEWGGLHVCANAALPFYFSSEGYGLLLNSGWPSRFAVGEAKVSDPPPAHSIERSKGPWEWGQNSGEEDPNDLSLILENGRMDVFLILRAGEDAIRGYSELTGKAPLPPKWALGYMQSKNRYRSSEEFQKLAEDYRKRKIPCDTLVLDWLWFHQFGDMEWDPEYWKDPEGMLQKIHDLGFHVMQAYHPFIYEDSLKVKEFREKGFLMGTPPNTLPIFDHSNPAAREEWWKQTKRFADQGIDAYWIDMGEPRDHPQGTTSYLGSREHVHNLYSLFWAQGLYEGHRRDLSTRIFSLSRTSYAGIQRYGAALWSNDIDSSWEVLRDQVPAGLGVCLSGLPYWCTDIGGFATDDRFSPELFIRWLEWGVFCPLFRTHGTRPENEVWSYGPQAEGILRRWIGFRYRLTPYLYACAREVTETGKPMMRALCLDFPDDPEACAQKYEYMFGPAFLVAPILEKNARSREVYLPRGVWYNYYTDEKLEGGRYITAQAPLDQIPLYIREGAVIPMMEECQYIGEKPEDSITVHVYGTGPASFTMYDDDGETYRYEQGGYAKTLLSFDGKDLKAVVTDGDASVIPQGRNYQLLLHTGERECRCDPSFDCDWTVDGVSRIHMTMDVGNENVEVGYTLEAPSGWRLTDAPCYFRKTPLAKGKKTGCGVIHMEWEFTPIREVLTACPSAMFKLTISRGGTDTVITKKIGWGSGCVSRVNVIGFFDDANFGDAAVMAQIESGKFEPYYLLSPQAEEKPARAVVDDGELSAGGTENEVSDQAISWNRLVSANCFGYLDLRPMAARGMKNGKGAGYARFLVWSPEDTQCRFEFSAERSFTLWVNGEKIYEKDGMEPKQIPETSFQLRKGCNVLLVKNTVDYPEQRSGREIGFSLRLLTMDGENRPELLYGI